MCVCAFSFSQFNTRVSVMVFFLRISELVHLHVGKVLALLCSSFPWLWPRQTVVVPGPRLMSGFAALQRTLPPCWCEAADHHIGPTLLQSYKSPTVRPGPNRTATTGDGQVHQEEGWGKHGGRRGYRVGGDWKREHSTVCSPPPMATYHPLTCSPL